MRPSRRLGTLVPALSVLGLAVTSLSIPAPAQAALLPAAYRATASAGIARVGLVGAAVPLADLGVGLSSASVDSTLPSGNSRAAASNLSTSLAGTAVPTPVVGVTAVAPPSQVVTGGVPAVVGNPVLGLGAFQNTAAAAYTTAATCIPSAGDVRETSSSSTTLTALDLFPGILALPLPVPGVTGPLVSVATSSSSSSTRLVNAASMSSVVSRTSTTVGSISVAGQVTITLAGPIVATATSNGSAGTFLASVPTVSVTLAGQQAVVVLPGQTTTQGPVTVSVVNPTNTSAGATGAGSAVGVLRISVALAGVSATVDLAPLAVSATAPPGGVECPGDDLPGGPGGDPDGDGIPTSTEITLGTDPLSADTDGDGLTDGVEVDGSANSAYGFRPTDPLDADSDDDGRGDGAEVATLKLRQQVLRPGALLPRRIGRVRTDPNRRDTDGDRLSDGAEVRGFRLRTRVLLPGGAVVRLGRVSTDPLRRDTDRDGLPDRAEVKGSKNQRFAKRRSDPTRWNTDRSGPSDGKEIRRGTDPTSARR